MAHHPQMLPLDRIRSRRSHEEKKNPSEPDLMKVSSQTTTTLYVAKTPNTAVPNGRSVTWEGRTGWEDRYIDTDRHRPRVRPGGNGSSIRTVHRYRSTPPAKSTWRERFKHQDRTSIQIDTAREFDLAGTVQASGPVWTVAGYLVTSQWDSIPRSSNV